MAKRSSQWLCEIPGEGYSAVVTADSRELATVEAAKKWRLPWPKVAHKIEVRYEGSVYEYICVRCGRAVYSSTKRSGTVRCEPCARWETRSRLRHAAEIERRQAQARREARK